MSEDRISKINSLLRRRGIILPSFELYGGVSGLIDYGPIGAVIKRRVISHWIQHWSRLENIVEIDSPTITPERVLEASGHVSEFNDFMSICSNCKSAFRSDHLIEGHYDDADSMNEDELKEKISDLKIKCPTCNNHEWRNPESMNLMFSTKIGAINQGRIAYLRPETAQGMFMLYPSLFRHFRQKLPFGAIQVGKGYRNEISPRQGMIRLREFNMAELEYFIDPENHLKNDLSKWSEKLEFISSQSEQISCSIKECYENDIIKDNNVAFFIAMTWEFLIDIGIDAQKIRFRQHKTDEMAHYASDCWDCELLGSHGWIECVGIANRTCHDLESHEGHSKSNLLRGWRKFDEPSFISKKYISPISSIIGPHFKSDAKEVSNLISNMNEMPQSFPFDLNLADGRIIKITEEMIELKNEEEVIHGEYFTPHVIEPAFGIDRIIWHIIDHSFIEIKKEGESYTILNLKENIAPYDLAILPLFDKEKMVEIGKTIMGEINSIPGVSGHMDTTRSIGRRYARADEIGIPWCVTVDYTSLEDSTVTIRRMIDQNQVRVKIKLMLEKLRNGSFKDLF